VCFKLISEKKANKKAIKKLKKKLSKAKKAVKKDKKKVKKAKGKHAKKKAKKALKKVAPKVTANKAPVKDKKSLSRREVFLAAGAATIASTFWDVEFVGVVKEKRDAAPALPSINLLNGVYSDPNHKNGYRIVRATDKSNAVVTLQDEPKGPIITVDGKIKTSKKSGTTITLDLSPKGGPSDVVATFSNGSGGDQLYFPDGNAWTKSVGVDGIYADPNHPAGYRVVRVAKNKMYITLQDEPKGEVIEVEGKKGKNGYLLDFSSKGGPKNIAAIVEDGKLVFPDGNAWTKM